MSSRKTIQRYKKKRPFANLKEFLIKMNDLFTNLFNMLLCSSTSENAHAVAVFANTWLIVFVQKIFRKNVIFNVYLIWR